MVRLAWTLFLNLELMSRASWLHLKLMSFKTLNLASSCAYQASIALACVLLALHCSSKPPSALSCSWFLAGAYFLGILQSLPWEITIMEIIASQCHWYCTFRASWIWYCSWSGYFYITTQYNWSFHSLKVSEGTTYFLLLILTTLDRTPKQIRYLNNVFKGLLFLSSQEGNEVEDDISRIQEESGN